MRVYRRMRRARQLPPIEKLLGIVEQYKLTDSRWLNGYPPELSNWLHTRQFEKAPLVRPKKSFFGKLFGKPDPDPVLTPEERHQAEIYRAQVKALHERFTSSTLSATPPLPGDDADALISLWPEPERQRVPVTGFLNYLAGKGKKLDVGQLVPLAREYRSDLANESAGWLHNERQHAQFEVSIPYTDIQTRIVRAKLLKHWKRPGNSDLFPHRRQGLCGRHSRGLVELVSS